MEQSSSSEANESLSYKISTFREPEGSFPC